MTRDDVVRTAGGSQRLEADACRTRAREYARLQQHELDLALRHEAAARGEASVAATLQALTLYGWRVLADRQWPRSAGNVDLVVVGPGGVLVIDAKTWAEPRVEAGHLFRGDEDETDSLVSLAASATPVVADVLTGAGYAPTGVLVVAVLAGRAMPATDIGPAVVVGEHDLPRYLQKRRTRLDAEAVDTVTALLEKAFPPYVPSGRRASTTRVTPPAPRRPVTDETASLFDVDSLADADRDAAAAGPIEGWMTWLHPDQAPLVARTWNGPARLSGPAGTGKTVVALHRVAAAARRPGSKVLVTAYVKTLANVLGELVDRLVPEHAHRVEAAGVHAWGTAFLRERGVRCRVDLDHVGSSFGKAWSRVGRHSLLQSVPVLPTYWQDEIVYVIKGRGLTRFEDYAALERVGRRTPLRLEQREAMWQLFCAYEEALHVKERHDFADVLTLARDELRARPLDEPYTAVVVDEVQDLTMVGVQLLHALVGDRADGLLLVGDSTQALYPGGFRLSEAGVAVVGRSVRLGTNYRNGAAILEHVRSLGAEASELDTDNPDNPDDPAPDDATAHRDGGRVVIVEAESDSSLEDALLRALTRHLESGARPGDCAVLARSNADVARWTDLLALRHVPVIGLAAYRGQQVDAVKVGTVHRAKGLEFGHVVLVDADPRPERRSGEDEDAYAERAEGWRREVHVAMTRARDTLWCGRVVGSGSRR